MRRIISLFIFSCAVLYLSAQEKIFSDSIPKKHPEIIIGQPIIERPLNFAGSFNSGEVNLIDYSLFRQPLLPVYKNLDFIKYLNLSKTTNTSYYSSYSFDYRFPMGNVFNQSTFQLNDRILIGGNNFGAQGIGELPKLNSSIQDMSIKGASMFMQYKVSDHFRVETRVSISNHNPPVWVP